MGEILFFNSKAIIMKKTKKSLNIALGTTLLSGLAATTVQADVTHLPESKTFEMTELSSGYMQLAEADVAEDAATKKKEGACGEGKCGSNHKEENTKTEEGKCGEGKCGSDKKEETKTETTPKS